MPSGLPQATRQKACSGRPDAPGAAAGGLSSAMTRENSPTYQQGLDDGASDSVLASSCPPGAPLGPMPPFPAYPVMYLAGYRDAYQPVPCPCDGSCKRGKQYGEAPELISS